MTSATDPEIVELAARFRALLTEKLCARLLDYEVLSTTEVERLVRKRQRYLGPALSPAGFGGGDCRSALPGR